jgi:hypothetical protein
MAKAKKNCQSRLAIMYAVQIMAAPYNIKIGYSQNPMTSAIVLAGQLKIPVLFLAHGRAWEETNCIKWHQSIRDRFFIDRNPNDGLFQPSDELVKYVFSRMKEHFFVIDTAKGKQ